VSALDTMRKVISLRPDDAESRAVPRSIEERLHRGRKWVAQDARKRRLCQLFLKGEAYFYLDNKGSLNYQETALGVQGNRRPTHRVRNRYNFIRPMVDAKVSSSTTRVPGYEVNPSSTDAEDTEAASLAQKIVRQGYEKWYLREARVKATTLAIGGGGTAFALPYFDPMVGPFRQVAGDPETGEEGQTVGEGEIKILLLNGNEVGCEPGVEFYHSRWYYVETARPIGEVREMAGFNGAKLTADASTADLPTDKPNEDMCMVTLYFERPCPKYPDGRMLTIAGGQQIVPEGPYPLMAQGKVLDAPCIHRLSYRLDPDNERDLGLTWELIDFQRTLNDILNKCVEIKNRGLHLQMIAPEGSIRRARTDEPDAITYYLGTVAPQWERAPDPAILGQLLNIFDRVLSDMRYVAADTDVDVAPNVAAGAVSQVIQQAANRWSSFLGDLARWDSEVARHCLLLAQNHYTEERTLKIRGRLGWEPEASFRGADIMGQIDVTVNPATIETRSRQAILQQLAWIQANFPGYVRPEVAIEIAMNGASPESLIERFENDKARANMIIQKIRDGSIMAMPTRMEMGPGPVDPLTGAPGPPQMLEVPIWMPRPFDEVAVQKWVFEGWLKSSEAANLPPDQYEQAMLIYQGFQQLEAQQQAQAMAAQTAQAEELGASNAAKPQEAKALPSTPSPAAPDGQ
jgi:hypothetical protein